MIKICDIEIVKPLYLIYMKCLETGRFPSSCKKANVLSIHKKENRQLKKNCRPISPLPICGKIFEKLIFDTIYEYLFENQLLTPNQSGFRPGDPTVNQLLSLSQARKLWILSSIFHSHIREAIIKAMRGIGIIHFLSKYVSRDVIDQIHKFYARPHLDYGDIIYHKYDPEI